MIFSVKIINRAYQINLENPLHISIPLDFDGAQPNAYAVEKAASKPYETGNLIGDTRRGGSCNFEQIKFIPHCNGTHTESIGHITHARISVHDCLQDVFIPATLVSVAPKNAGETNETYAVDLSSEDKLITRHSLESALQKNNENFLDGLIIRTLPNDKDKLTKTYLEEIPPFFSTEAMNFIREKNIKHLLVDVPSIDRIFDEGKLSNHRIFWNVEAGSFESSEESFPHKTVTEMIFAPELIEDGEYLLNLQIAAFKSDASPSRPILFKVFE
jgi:kynurenine formamidase